MYLTILTQQLTEYFHSSFSILLLANINPWKMVSSCHKYGRFKWQQRSLNIPARAVNISSLFYCTWSKATDGFCSYFPFSILPELPHKRQRLIFINTFKFIIFLHISLHSIRKGFLTFVCGIHIEQHCQQSDTQKHGINTVSPKWWALDIHV